MKRTIIRTRTRKEGIEMVVERIAPRATQFPAGTRIYYTGDPANIDGWGRIAEAGSTYTIRLDDGREFRGVFPQAVAAVYTGTYRDRFVTFEAYRTRKIAELERIKAMPGARVDLFDAEIEKVRVAGEDYFA